MKRNKKLHEESVNQFFAGNLGEAIGKSTIDSLFQAMKETNSATVEAAFGFFSPEMEYEDGDVEVSVAIRLKRIGEAN
jgi:hypothetical protein